MAYTTVLLLLLFCGVSQQAPKQITRRGNISRVSDQDDSRSVIMDENIDVKNISTKKTKFRGRQEVELGQNMKRYRAMAAQNDQKLEKDSTFENTQKASLQERTSKDIRDDSKTGTRQNNQEYANNIDGKNSVVHEENNDAKEQDSLGSASSSGDYTESQSDDDESADTFQDERQSGDENTEDAAAQPNNPNTSEDYVDAFVKSDSVSGTTKDAIADNMPNEHDSVRSYIGLNSNREKKGNRRDKIEESEVQDQDATTGRVDDADTVPGDAKDKIPAVQSEISTDSVSPYIELTGSQETGALRNDIAKKENNDDNEEQERAAVEDSNESFIGQRDVSGTTKDVLPRKSKQDDSVAPYIETVNQQKKVITRNEIADNTETSASGEAVVNDDDDDDDDDEDNNESETIVREIGGEDEASGENKLHSSKTKAILEGLEEDLSDGRSSRQQSKEKLTFEPGLSDEPWHHKSHNKKSKQHSSSYVVQQSYGVPIQYNIPVYTTVPQYMYVNISDAERKGAVCLDGSTPGYFYRNGVGKGSKRWIIYLQGGAWCDSEEACYQRSMSNLGSSLKFNYLTNVEGLLSRDKTKNPDFYDWNVAYVPYCDGASYTGNRSHPVNVRGRMIYFRGKRILSALLDDLLAHGLSDSNQLVFSGTSAGGLAVIINADYVRSRIPSKAKVYSLADSGVFLDANDMGGKSMFADSMQAVYKLHESSGSINSKCAAHQGKASAWKCLFPSYFGEYIKSPLFIVNPLYDSWQLANVVKIHCAYQPEKCNTKEMKEVKNFRVQTLKALIPFTKNPNIGLFADGCVDHGQIIFSPKWTKIRVKNRSMSGTFSRWIKNEENDKSVIDRQSDEYPFNPTCVSHFHD